MSPSMPSQTVSWTSATFRRFKAAYAAAKKVKTSQGTFMFEGNEFVLAYAKHLVEFLEMQDLGQRWR